MRVKFLLEGMICRYPRIFHDATEAKKRDMVYYLILSNDLGGTGKQGAYTICKGELPQGTKHAYPIPTYEEYPGKSDEYMLRMFMRDILASRK